MNPAIATVVGAVVAGLVALLVAVVNTVVGRRGRRVDIADKVSEAWERTSERLDKDLAKIEAKCDKCEARLIVTERTLEQSENERHRLRAALRMVLSIDPTDPVAIAQAFAAARELV